MADLWTGQWRDLTFRVELRSHATSGGNTLRIGPISSESATANLPSLPSAVTEWLRFDCFDKNPHWHVEPSGRNQIHPLTDDTDPVAEAFQLLVGDLPGLLERAGAPAVVVASAARDGDDTEKRIFFRDAERAMRHRPAILEALDVRKLKRRRSSKWRQYPQDVLPAWVAEMDFPIAAPIHDDLTRFMRISDLGYPLDPGDTGFPDAFCERMHERFDWTPDPTRIELLSEVVQGMHIAVDAYSEVGDGVIVQTPIYPPFLKVVSESKRRLVENPLVSKGARLEFDLDGLADRIDGKTRVLLLCNPHNPSGRVMVREELERIAALVLEHDLIVVSDEIHADLLFDGRVHIPFATLGPEIAKRTVTLTSASKAFNLPGLRCAVAHFGTADLHERFNQCHPDRIRGGIGLFGIHASIAAWRWGQPWLDEVVPYLQANRDFAKHALSERIPEIGFNLPESTYLAWLDCRALDLKGSPTIHFLTHGRVALSSGHRFGDAYRDFARLNFATSRPILTDVIDRMAKALGR